MIWWRHHARLRGLDAAWALALAASWLAVAAAGQIAIPRLDPTTIHGRHPLETLSTVALLLPTATHLRGLLVQLPDIESVRAVQRRTLAACSFIVQLVVGVLLLGGLCHTLLPAGLDTAHVVLDWVVLFGAGATAAAGRSRVAVRRALAAPLGVVLPCSIAGAVPWRLNILFNDQAGVALWTCAALTTVAALASGTSTPGGPDA